MADKIANTLAHRMHKEFFIIPKFRNKLEAGRPRDFLSALQEFPIFEVFAENWRRIQTLTPSEVNEWLLRNFPRHRRALPSMVASSATRAAQKSIILRIDLMEPWNLEHRSSYSLSLIHI